MARKGFTLLEVLMVIAVLAILASMTFVVLRYVDGAKVTSTEGRVHVIGVEIGGLRFAPEKLEELAPRLNQPGWIKEGKFVDAWDRPLEYRVEGKRFRLWSCGPDGVSGTADDLPYKRN